MGRSPFTSAFAGSLVALFLALPAQVLANPISIYPANQDLIEHALVALVVEVPIVAALFPRRRLRLALTCAVATGLTYLLLHWLLGLRHWGVLPLLGGEVFAMLAEAGAYAAVSRELGRSVVASVLANSASFVVGLALF